MAQNFAQTLLAKLHLNLREAMLVTVIASLAFGSPALSTALRNGFSFSPRADSAGSEPAGAHKLISAAVETGGRTPERVHWIGKDLDKDGAADVANPTGYTPRGWDAYGSGAFGASRDGGVRHHAGVDYVARPGQLILAPISGFVSKIGYPYGDDLELRYVEIFNPALNISARVFYVEPQVQIGEAVAISRPIGTARTLQGRYPSGITDHVHLELADHRGVKLDPSRLIFAEARS